MTVLFLRASLAESSTNERNTPRGKTLRPVGRSRHRHPRGCGGEGEAHTPESLQVALPPQKLREAGSQFCFEDSVFLHMSLLDWLWGNSAISIIVEGRNSANSGGLVVQRELPQSSPFLWVPHFFG